MKKLLSILLICTLLLSAIPFVTASAEVTSANAKVVSIDGEKKTLSEWFASAAGSAMEGKEVTLLSDITVNSWTTISKFSGILNGNGHSISGLNVPMFSRLDGATIKNLTVNGSFDGLKSKMIGAIACETVGNVMLQNVICNVNMDIHQSTGNVGFGGLIGYVNGGKTVLTDCVNNGDIYASDTTSCYSGAMAGMVGWTVNNTELIATRCVNTGNVYGSTTNANGDATNTIVLGGIVGWANSSVTLVGCMNYGEVKNTAPSAHGGCKVGGLAGIMNPSADSDAQFIFEDCVNYGDVLGYRCAGGMVGQLTHKLEMTNCYNYGSIRSGYGESSVNATTSFASGLIGILGANKGGAVIVACANYGDLSTTSNKGYHEVYAGGAVAYLECPAELISFSNHGTVSAMKYAGGIVANVAKDGIDINIRNCLSAGVVSIQENAMSDPASAAMIGNIAKGNVSFFDSAYLPTVNANVSNGIASGVSSEITSVESVSAWKDMQEISFANIFLQSSQFPHMSFRDISDRQ